MKQQLWILNSSLVFLFLLVSVFLPLLQVEPPHLAIMRTEIETPKKKGDFSFSATWEKIYKADLFKTFSPPPPPPPAQQLQPPPLPEAETPSFTPPPPAPKQEFIEPLNVTIKGIIISSDEAKSVAMIEDETKKEGLYHLGEKIRDAQIIKITRRSITFLRASGQQEIFFLKKDETALLPEEEGEKWQYIIKKINENMFEIDPEAFVKEVESLGNFLERTGIIGTVYQQGIPVGIRIGAVQRDELASLLGLQANDLLISINNLSVAEQKSRVEAYDKLLNLVIGDTINVKIKRNQQEITIGYTLTKIAKKRKTSATGANAPGTPGEKLPEQQEASTKKESLPMNKMQEREQQLRQFKQQHQQQKQSQQQQETIEKIRQRLLANLRDRIKNSRIR